MGDQEMAIRTFSLGFGRGVLEVGLGLDRGHRGPRVDCGQGHPAEFVSYREKSFDTVLGEVELSRAYYHCEACGRGVVPKDRELGVVGVTVSPGLARLVARMGSQEPFEQSRQDLAELAEVQLTTKRIERFTESLGEQLQGREVAELKAIAGGEVVLLPASQDTAAPGPGETLYILMDGASVPTVGKETEGRQGRGEDGRSRSREVKLGCLFTQSGLDAEGWAVRDEDTTSYIQSMAPAAEFGILLKGEALRRGLARFQTSVVIGDGADWIWNIAGDHFADSIEIVDYWHARENLGRLAKLAFPIADSERAKWLARRLDELELGDMEALLENFAKLLRRRASRFIDEAALQTAIGYFENNQHRMYYGAYRELGLFLGSGVVEAGCKNVAALRLKRSGMRWTVRGASSVLTLRCCYMSRRWDAFWKSRHLQMQVA